MALTLSLREGEDLYFNDDRMVLKQINGPSHAVVELGGGVLFDLVDDKTVEIIPGVMVGLGIQTQADWAKLIIEAPRRIAILRGQLYRNESRGMSAAK